MKNPKTKRGSVTMELATIALLMIVATMLSVDVGVVALGCQINDSACRDAARAAAQGLTSASAYSLAQASLKSHTADGTFVTQPTLAPVDFIYQDYSGNPPQDQSPYVSVTTSSTVRIPAPIFFYGASFGKNGAINFRRTYTFPIVKTTLYLH